MKRAPKSKRKLVRRDAYKPVTREQVTDIALLPRRFDTFAAEMRTSLEILGVQVTTALARIEETLGDLKQRVEVVERVQLSTIGRIDALEASRNRKKIKS